MLNQTISSLSRPNSVLTTAFLWRFSTKVSCRVCNIILKMLSAIPLSAMAKNWTAKMLCQRAPECNKYRIRTLLHAVAFHMLPIFMFFFVYVYCVSHVVINNYYY